MSKDTEAILEMACAALNEAKHLRSGGYPRGTASRSYYAMHDAATAMLLAVGERFEQHGQVIGAFGRLFAKTGRVDRKFHRYLIDAFESRGVADYDAFPEPPMTMEKAALILSWAEEFVTMAEEFLKSEGESTQS
jgi:uncharacterized protein (UPF0332 family)